MLKEWGFPVSIYRGLWKRLVVVWGGGRGRVGVLRAGNEAVLKPGVKLCPFGGPPIEKQEEHVFE